MIEESSLERINDRTLKHLTQYSPLIPNAQRSSLLAADTPASVIRQAMNISLLSEFPLLLSRQMKFSVPVFAVWGACEDVVVLEKFRQGTYDVENLHVIDEATTRCLDIGGIKLRILGLGGAFVPHKMFDNGEGRATIAGGQGTMWTTALQIGELVDTAQRVYDASETRLLVSHASPGREGIIAQLALVLKADLTISAGLHFRYTSSWNEFSVQGDFEGFRHKILSGKDSFDKIWESVKPQVEAVVDENQRMLLDKALHVVSRVPAIQPHIGPGATATGEEPAWKNCWNWNLCDAAYGSLVLDIKEGRVSAELKSQGTCLRAGKVVLCHLYFSCLRLQLRIPSFTQCQCHSQLCYFGPSQCQCTAVSQCYARAAESTASSEVERCLRNVFTPSAGCEAAASGARIRQRDTTRREGAEW